MLFARIRGKPRTLQVGPNYATLVSDRRYLATSTHIFGLHEHVATREILESLKIWSGHGLSNRTGFAGPDKEACPTRWAAAWFLQKEAQHITLDTRTKHIK